MVNEIGHEGTSERGLDGKVLREYFENNGVWSWKKDYVYREGQHLASVAPSSVVKHFHLDHLGTVRRITDSSGVIVGSHDYYPFGQEATNPSADGERMKFTGHERDLRDPTKTTDDLDYMHARYYNPHIGRFLRLDPGRDWNPKDPQSWNTYTYVRGNPLTFTDPTGNAVAVMDARAMAYILSTLPEEVRHKIKLDDKGFIDKKIINQINSNDANFKALKALVNFAGIIRVFTSTAAIFRDKSGKTVTERFFFDPSTKPPAGFFGIFATPPKGTNPFGRAGVFSISGDLEVQLPRLPGLPKLEIQKTTAHELFGHALLYVQGKPFEHTDPGVDEFIREVERRFGP